MNDELRRCPNCGAYVMGNDSRCPRCDFDLDTAADAADTAASDPDRTEIFDAPPPPPDHAEAGDQANDRADDQPAADAADPVTDQDATSDPVPTELLNGAELLAVHIGPASESDTGEDTDDESDAHATEAAEAAPDDDGSDDDATQRFAIAAETPASGDDLPDDIAPKTADHDELSDKLSDALSDEHATDDAADAVNVTDSDADADTAPDSADHDLNRAIEQAAADIETDIDAEATPHRMKRTPPPIAPLFEQQHVTPRSEAPHGRADMHITRPSTEQDAPPVSAPDASAVQPAAPGDKFTEMPTQAIEQEREASADPSDLHATQPHAQAREFIVPPAPYTPPPVAAPPPPATIAPPGGASYIPPDQRYAHPVQHVSSGDAAIAYLQQRVQAYRHGNYRVETHGQYEASLTYGKHLSVGTWMLALLTVIGAFWYVLILAASGFRADVVYVVLENDGRVYEDGPGAAHIRGKRSRTGRRWSAFGLLLFFISLIIAVVLTVIAGVVLTQDRYQAALREAYPAVTLFEDHFSAERADPGDVDLAKDAAVAFSIVAVLTAVGLWGGATLFVIGTVHASAYRTRVPPLPGWA